VVGVTGSPEVGVRGGVFINYRSADSGSYGALLYLELSRFFGSELVFLDSESIPAGADFAAELVRRVRGCMVLLAVIGPSWLAAVDELGRRRIDDPQDWVRREFVEAFAAGVTVVPVLTDDAVLPAVEDLPADIAALARCQSRRLRHREASADATRLIADLARMGGNLASARSSALSARSAPPAVVTALFQLPPDVPDFVGRAAEVRAVRQRLAPSGRRTGTDGRFVAIFGQPGAGKTTLALRVAHAIRDEFPDGQLFVDLAGAERQPREPADVLAELLRAHGFRDSALPRRLPDLVALHRSVVDQQRLILVLDNAADERQVRPLLPGSATVGVLLTSRTPLTGLEGAWLLRLETLPAAAAVQLLRRVPGTVGRKDHALARRIVEYCGQLPLAVRIAGARLASEQHLGLAELTERLADEARRLSELRAGDREVRGTFEVSYRGRPPEQQYLFRLLGLAGPVAFAPWLAAALAGVAESPAAVLLEDLARAQLVLPVGGQRYRLHDLIRVYAAELATADPVECRAALDRAARACMALQREINAVVLPSESDRPGSGEHRFTGAADALARFDAEKDAMVAVVVSLCSVGEAGLAWQLAAELPALLQLRGDLGLWRRMTEAVLAATGRANETFGHARVLLEYGNLCREAGNWAEAAESYRRASEVLRDAGDLHWQADAIASLGAVHRDQNRLEESVRELTEAADLYHRAGSLRGVALTLSNLGSTLLKQGRDTDADHTIRRSLEIFVQLGDRRWAAYCLADLGEIHQYRQAWDEAAGYQEEALAVLAGYGDRLGVARCAGHLGDTRRAQGRLTEARDYYSHSLNIIRELSSPQERVLAEARLASVSPASDTGR
jgi:tetratricopeptide (TPR) repeat protein